MCFLLNQLFNDMMVNTKLKRFILTRLASEAVNLLYLYELILLGPVDVQIGEVGGEQIHHQGTRMHQNKMKNSDMTSKRILH